jgi:pantetheine-phosphate adenylyltransferase
MTQLIKAIYPGTFDPITRGHLDVIARSAKLFASVEVVVGHNAQKKSLFTVEERVALIREEVASLSNVTVSSYSGLMVNYLRENKAQVIIRGLRAVSDFEYEFQMALMNQKLDKECETVFLAPREHFSYLNSSIVKEIAALGGDISELVTSKVEKALKHKVREKN